MINSTQTRKLPQICLPTRERDNHDYVIKVLFHFVSSWASEEIRKLHKTNGRKAKKSLKINKNWKVSLQQSNDTKNLSRRQKLWLDWTRKQIFLLFFLWHALKLIIGSWCSFANTSKLQKKGKANNWYEVIKCEQICINNGSNAAAAWRFLSKNHWWVKSLATLQIMSRVNWWKFRRAKLQSPNIRSHP